MSSDLPEQQPARRRRWWLLSVVCLGASIVAIDSTAIAVALPTMGAELGLTDTSLSWIVNAYLIAYAGSLMLGGRCGDLFGSSRIFIGGVVAFATASLVCALSTSESQLIFARGAQGLAGGIVSTGGFSVVTKVFLEPAERAVAFGIYGFAASAATTFAALVGGLLTSMLNWRWIFLINVPIAIVVVRFGSVSLEDELVANEGRALDFAGAAIMTISLIAAVSAVLNGNNVGWDSPAIVALCMTSTLLLLLFLWIESRVPAPFLPLRLLQARNLASCCMVNALFSAGASAMVFVALYLQRVLGYSAFDVGLVFLPSGLVMTGSSLVLSVTLLRRFGAKRPLVCGTLLVATGLMILGRAPPNGDIIDVLPALLVVSIGAGIAMNPLLVAAVEDVLPSDLGIVSGVIATASTMGSALGLAVFAGMSAARTKGLLASGETVSSALNDGYHVAFCGGALAALMAAGLSVTLLDTKRLRPRTV